MKLRICVACMNNLVAEPGQVRCSDCVPATVGRPRKPRRFEPTADQLRAAGISPTEAAAYLNS
jgi:hypothetical protein